MGRPRRTDGLTPAEYREKFNVENYDRVFARVKKGKMDVYKRAAEAAGMSFSAFLEAALDRAAGAAVGKAD